MSFFNQTEIKVVSSVDNSTEPSLFFEADTTEGARPLLVGLHTWSFDRFNQVNAMLPYAQKYNFHLLLPEFRGSNKPDNPRCTEACGSPIAVADIFDAIAYVTEHYSIDKDNITVVATGPLTSEALAEVIEGITGGGELHFFDAAAPIVDFSSVDMSKAFFASRYGKGDPEDYLNCPMTREEYDAFYN